KNLWKVYGAHADRIGRGDALFAGDRVAACEKLRAGGHIPAVIDANFVVHTGEIFVIMGLSGSGKSTLVRCLARLIEPSSGQVLLDEEDLLAASAQRLIELRRREMGMVFQHFGLCRISTSSTTSRSPSACRAGQPRSAIPAPAR